MPILDPYSRNSSTKVSVQIGQSPAKEYTDLVEYSIDSNVLTLSDVFSVKIADPSGERALEFVEGDPVDIFMSDPNVGGGAKFQIMKGLIVDLDTDSDDRGGTVVTVSGADLGWHLVETPGELFKSLMGLTFQTLLDNVLDPSWGFRLPSRTSNDLNRRLSQGRAGIAAARAPVDVFIPPVCFEAGEMIADKLITYARRVKKLVNVSGDGYLQIFSPDYTTAPAFTLHYHKPTETELRRMNNVLAPVKIHRSISGLYTKTICVGTVAVPSVLPDRFNPHAGTFKGVFDSPNALPFKRINTFCDSDALTQQMANYRAQQRAQRGQFDAWTGTYRIEGHVLGGTFIAPDTNCEISDTLNKVSGNHYISARRLERKIGGGTTTAITVHKQNLLGA